MKGIRTRQSTLRPQLPDRRNVSGQSGFWVNLRPHIIGIHSGHFHMEPGEDHSTCGGVHQPRDQQRLSGARWGTVPATPGVSTSGKSRLQCPTSTDSSLSRRSLRGASRRPGSQRKEENKLYRPLFLQGSSFHLEREQRTQAFWEGSSGIFFTSLFPKITGRQKRARIPVLRVKPPV